MSDIFISYASPDRSRIKPLVDEMHRRGWSVWWDRTIPPGKTWDQVIEAALTDARCVIVLWSRDSVQSDWVLIEAHHAKRRGILVPALLDDVVIPLAFSRIHAANLVEWNGVFPNAEFDELARAVTAVLPKHAPPALETTTRPAPAPLPVPPAPITTRRRHVWPSRTTLTIVVGTVFACMAGLAWYFVPGHRQASKSSGSTLVPNQVREDPKGEAPALRPTVSSNPGPGTGRPPARTNLKDGLKYVFIPAGKFMMGCSPGDAECFDSEKPPHAEQIANGFWLGQTEVTQAAWNKVNIGVNPSRFKGDQLPVETVDWNQASAYCEAIGGRLPTEKEWEYAARAGTTRSRYGDLDAIAWYEANSGGTTHPVGLKQANAFGLYDMLGNVFEWTSDNYDDEHKTVRAGSWNGDSRSVRASYRFRNGPTFRVYDFGFRCVGELR